MSENGARSWSNLIPVMVGVGASIAIGIIGWNFNELSNMKDSMNRLDDRLIKLESVTVTPQEHSALHTLVESNRERLATFDARLSHIEQDQHDQREELSGMRMKK